VDWIPVDLLADILVQLATDGSSSATAHTLPVYHAVNPKAVDWASLVPTVARHLGPSVKVVSWAEWMDALRNSRGSAMTAVSLKQNPALKLFDFFDSVATAAEKGEEWPSFETKETLKKSPRMAKVKAVSEEWMELWLKQWKF
jgi:dTDP-4-dehydrorhamnose reductase